MAKLNNKGLIVRRSHKLTLCCLLSMNHHHRSLAPLTIMIRVTRSGALRKRKRIEVAEDYVAPLDRLGVLARVLEALAVCPDLQGLILSYVDIGEEAIWCPVGHWPDVQSHSLNDLLHVILLPHDYPQHYGAPRTLSYTLHLGRHHIRLFQAPHCFCDPQVPSSMTNPAFSVQLESLCPTQHLSLRCSQDELHQPVTKIWKSSLGQQRSIITYVFQILVESFQTYVYDSARRVDMTEGCSDGPYALIAWPKDHKYRLAGPLSALVLAPTGEVTHVIILNHQQIPLAVAQEKQAVWRACLACGKELRQAREPGALSLMWFYWDLSVE